MIKSLKLAALAAGVACAMPALAVDLTAISFGGASKDAQVKAFYEPFEKATGNKILAGEYNGEMARVKAMVDTNSVSWNEAATKACSRPSIQPSSATRATSSKAPFSHAAWASLSGPQCWRTTPTNWPRHQPVGRTSGTLSSSPASVACARARNTPWNLP